MNTQINPYFYLGSETDGYYLTYSVGNRVDVKVELDTNKTFVDGEKTYYAFPCDVFANETVTPVAYTGADQAYDYVVEYKNVLPQNYDVDHSLVITKEEDSLTVPYSVYTYAYIYNSQDSTKIKPEVVNVLKALVAYKEACDAFLTSNQTP